MTFPFIQGMAVGGGLIVAIGAQNAFVLSQGIRRQHHWLVAAICFVCDAVLVGVGVAGVGRAVAASPMLQAAAAWGGAIFLFAYGARALRRAMMSDSLQAGGRRVSSVKEAVLATLAVTLFNPHVYLDTVVLLGSIASQFQDGQRLAFATGACSASFLWFFSLSLGGELLAPIFARPGSWKVLDLFVCGSMWLVAFRLLPV
ncbi:MAG: amino acid transporter [Desulfobulbaceae bacterium]|nr:MAG: amino acid transporter [Desulfobulbaceae bacterium]